MGYVDWDKQSWEPIVDGVSRKIVTADKLMVVMWKWDKGIALPVHAHPHDQYFYLISGKAIFQSENQERVMLPGDSWMIPGGVLHGTRYLEDSVTIDLFAPPREDMLAGTDPYVRGARKEG